MALRCGLYPDGNKEPLSDIFYMENGQATTLNLSKVRLATVWKMAWRVLRLEVVRKLADPSVLGGGCC